MFHKLKLHETIMILLILIFKFWIIQKRPQSSPQSGLQSVYQLITNNQKVLRYQENTIAQLNSKMAKVHLKERFWPGYLPKSLTVIINHEKMWLIVIHWKSEVKILSGSRNLHSNHAHSRPLTRNWIKRMKNYQLHQILWNRN